MPDKTNLDYLRVDIEYPCINLHMNSKHANTSYIATNHTYITLLMLLKWVFQLNRIKNYKFKFKLVKNISTIIL